MIMAALSKADNLNAKEERMREACQQVVNMATSR